MTSFPVDLLLLATLVATTFAVLRLHRRLKALDRLHVEYGRALKDAATALSCARDALATFESDGRNVLVLLGGRIEDAHALIAEIDARGAETRAPAPLPSGTSGR